MQINKSFILACTAIGFFAASFSLLAQQESQLPEQKNREPIKKQLEIDKTVREFKKAYVEYSVDPDESRRYLNMVRSNRELSQKVQDRALVLELNEQQIRLMKQQNQLKQLENQGVVGKSPEQPVELNLTNFIPDKKRPEVLPTLQSIDNGETAIFLFGNELGRYTAGDRLPNGEVIESVSSGSVVLKSNGKTRTLHGMPLGD